MVSVVIPCYNPSAYLLETIASARAQTWPEIEIILVNDGSTRPESLRILAQAASLADTYIEQANRGLGGARNTGFRAARSELVLPLDSDDLVRPEYVAACLDALAAHPAAAFIYTDLEVFGCESHVDRYPDYNLYGLLDRNQLPCAALIRKSDWERVGGYDESMRLGYEDWEFWLRLGARGRFGSRVPRPLFRYRKHGPSLFDVALAHHDELTAYIRRRHPELYDYTARSRIKAEWEPAVCIRGPHQPQTIADVHAADASCRATEAAAVLLPEPNGAAPQSAELAALAVWGGKAPARLPDGSVAVCRDAAGGRLPALRRRVSGGGRLRQHLRNAELDSREAWLRHPLRSTARLIPLRMKERINEAAGRPVFDLSFYLQFQPRSAIVGNAFVEPLRYMPHPATRRRVALVTPHLGPGGAESVLLEVASALDPECFEVLLLATHSNDSRWLDRWRAAAAQVYDLAPLITPQRMSAAIYSIVTNWQCEAVLVQNSLFGYAALPQIRQDAPQMRILDLVHSVDGDWDQVAATAGAAAAIDVRVAISDRVRSRLVDGGTPPERVTLVRNGVDLARFRPSQRRPGTVATALFAGRLDPVKRPLLLIDIAERLVELRGARDFRFVVAGDGPERAALVAQLRRKRLGDLFELAGHVEDTAPLFARCDVLVLPSSVEGVPLAVLEAMASGRPVVASNVGSVTEAVDDSCGVIIETVEAEAGRFAAALHRLFEDPALRAAMGAAGRSKTEAEYDRSRMRNSYRQLFERAD